MLRLGCLPLKIGRTTAAAVFMRAGISSAISSSTQSAVFDRSCKRKQRNRSALLPDVHQYEQLHEEVR